MNPEANKALLFDLGDTILRSWWTVVAGVCLGLTGALIALYYMPKEYEATARILISPAQISQEFIKSTVTEDISRRMLALEKAVISDRYMRELIERTVGLPETDAELRSLMRRIRGRVSVSTSGDMRGGWMAFDLNYRDSDRVRAAKIVNTLAALYVDQNTEFRAAQARDTAQILEQRVAEAQLEFEAIDRKLSEFNAAHSFETTDHLDANLRLAESRKRDLENNLSKQSFARQRRQELETELGKLEAGGTIEQRLTRLKTELDALLLQYSEAHPSVKRKRREIEDLLASMDLTGQVGTQGEEGEFVLPPDPQIEVLKQQIDRVNLELEVIQTEERRLRREIREYERRIEAVREVQPQLTALLAEHKTKRSRYEQLRSDAERARDAQFLEESQMAARFELAERAEVPRRPKSPNPKRFYPLGIIVGCMVFVGPQLLRRFLNPLVGSEAGLRAVADIPILVSIPRLMTPPFKGWAVRGFLKNFALALVSVGVFAAAFFYLR